MIVTVTGVMLIRDRHGFELRCWYKREDDSTWQQFYASVSSDTGLRLASMSYMDMVQFITEQFP